MRCERPLSNTVSFSSSPIGLFRIYLYYRFGQTTFLAVTIRPFGMITSPQAHDDHVVQKNIQAEYRYNYVF